MIKNGPVFQDGRPGHFGLTVHSDPLGVWLPVFFPVKWLPSFFEDILLIQVVYPFKILSS